MLAYGCVSLHEQGSVASAALIKVVVAGELVVGAIRADGQGRVLRDDKVVGDKQCVALGIETRDEDISLVVVLVVDMAPGPSAQLPETDTSTRPGYTEGALFNFAVILECPVVVHLGRAGKDLGADVATVVEAIPELCLRGIVF